VATSTALQKKGGKIKTNTRQDKSFRKTCSIALVSTASGRVLKPIVLGKVADFGEESADRKLKQLREHTIPGLGRLGDYLSIHSNASGYFDAEAYSKLVLEGTVAEYTQGVAPDEWSVMLHDAATTHKGKKEPKREAGQAAQPTVHYHFDSAGQPQPLKQWLKDRRVVEPNDQRMFNFLLRWKYDQTLAQLTGTWNNRRQVTPRRHRR
jgi:hypothetical protein